ncbi:MAG: beta 1-4 rhamnosyltransferase Cps2T [Suipraeoptans sp.]
MSDEMIQHVFIVGSKGIPGKYGGYETFVDKLTQYHQDIEKIKYHVACKGNSNKEFNYNNARCFTVKVPNIGAAQAVYYDICAIDRCCKYIKENKIRKPIIYILASRIGPCLGYFKKRIHKMGGRIFFNPDGHEWKRAKWNAIIQRYWKLSERLMVKHSDLVICDSKNIEKYIRKNYRKYNPNTTYIAYGAETKKSSFNNSNPELTKWYEENELAIKSYYLIVGRFVPENNYEVMIREFMQSKSERNLVIITETNEKFLDILEEKLNLEMDDRIKFVGTLYNEEMLMKVRENAYGYLHGHEVGGTNPSLLEALGSTNVNLLINVVFNVEVAKDNAVYWNKEKGNLAALIDRVDNMTIDQTEEMGTQAKSRIKCAYSWELITDSYKQVFIGKRKRS